MDTNQQNLYCVISARIIEDFVRYPDYEIFLIKSDKPVEFSKLKRAVGEYVALKNQIDTNLITIQNAIEATKIEDRNRWYEISESKGWCYEYISDFIHQVFL